MAPKVELERRPVSALVPYARNSRTHSDAQVAQIAGSIREFGFTNPILIDEKDSIIAGHGRVLAARKLGMADVPVVVLDHLTDDQKRAYIIADNKLALNAGWDEETLRAELEALGADNFDLSVIGFDDEELAALFNRPKSGLTDPDDAPEAPANPVSELGDVWLLGSHRLVCGDCTDADVVAEALSGVRPHLMVTDPPYGVMLDPSWRDRAGVNTMGKSGKGGSHYMHSGRDDTEARWDAVWALAPVEVFYVWCASGRIVEVHAALTDAGFDVRQHLVWDKGMLTRTRTHYWYSHEMCLYGVRKGKNAHWVGQSGQSIRSDAQSERSHGLAAMGGRRGIVGRRVPDWDRKLGSHKLKKLG